jgi:hypothetical protein
MTKRTPWLLPLLLLGLVLPAGFAPKEDPKDQAPRIDRLIAQLDDDDFQVRQTATEELKKIGLPAEAAVRRALAGSPSAEARQRLKDILATIAPRYEGSSPGWYWVYGAIAHAQTFKATGDKVQSLELRVARLNPRQPAAALEVEVRDLALGQIYARGTIGPEQSKTEFAWREVQWQKRPVLTPGQSYLLLFHSQDTTNRAPWLVNAIYSDLYPDGGHPGKVPHDFFFRLKYADGRALHVGPAQDTDNATPISSGSEGGSVVLGKLFIDGAGQVPEGKAAPDPGK